MKIAYICYRAAFPADGVVTKIHTQTGHWRSATHDVRVFCLSPRSADGRRLELEAEVFRFSSLRDRFGATRGLTRRVRQFDPDVIYLRYDTYFPPPRALLRDFASVAEINTDEAESRLWSRRAALYRRLNRRIIFANVDGFVCVTNELARNRALARSRKPTVVIANGYDIGDALQLPPAQNGRPRGAFIGHPGLPWHGLDKIVWLAQALPDLEFELIGPEPWPECPRNVHCHGFLKRDGYEPILARSDFALGTLALHRKGMNEASPLKVREYLLYGLPTIIAYEETDFLGERPWFLLQLPNTEDNVRTHLAAVREFIDGSKGRRVPRDEIEHRVSSETKERERLAFFEQLVARRAERSRDGSGGLHNRDSRE